MKSLAATLTSVTARKNSCAHVAADHEVSVQTLTEYLKTSTDTAHQRPGPLTLTGIRGSKRALSLVCTRRLEEHSVAFSQLSSRLSAVKKFGASTGEGPFSDVKELIKDLITDLLNKSQSEAPSEPTTSLMTMMC